MTIIDKKHTVKEQAIRERVFMDNFQSVDKLRDARCNLSGVVLLKQHTQDAWCRNVCCLDFRLVSRICG